MNRYLLIASWVVLGAGFAGCSQSTAKPADVPEVGVRENEQAAKQHEQSAAEHRAAAGSYGGLQAACQDNAPCWSALATQAGREQEQSDRQLKLAAEHRAKAKGLRDAEQRSCSGVSDYDRAVSPFFHQKDIADVAPIIDSSAEAKGRRVQGITVTFRAVEGLTAERLQKIADCHIARNTALGHDVPELHDCPLVPKVTALVTSGPKGLQISIRGQDSAAVDEVIRCSRVIEPTSL
jgi:hypothetical protein